MSQAEEQNMIEPQQEIPDEQQFNQVQQIDSEIQDNQPARRKRIKKNHGENSDDSSNMDNVFDDNVIMDKLPLERGKLQDMLLEVSSKLRQYRNVFFTQQGSLPTRKSQVGDLSIPVCADVTKFDFDSLILKQLQVANRQFDVLMMDPPWRLSSSQPSRGVAIQYQSMSDDLIQQIPVQKLQKEGFLFVWVINAKFQWTVNTMQKKWGYKVVDSINWVKKTVNDKIAKGHGFYLQHAKETCLVGYKGDFKNFTGNVGCDIIFSDRRGQSQKPTQIYQYIQELVPNGYYLQIFGRRNNLRDRWVTIGNQL